MPPARGRCPCANRDRSAGGDECPNALRSRRLVYRDLGNRRIEDELDCIGSRQVIGVLREGGPVAVEVANDKVPWAHFEVRREVVVLLRVGSDIEPHAADRRGGRS